ncbi:MAG: D-alanyl-D-alanine carboxypeptidase, partial [Chloroflexi bacterium]|nr:D-alanyl-D-alanine carboxypeptidase [Chloroflexota bacterium]
TPAPAAQPRNAAAGLPPAPPRKQGAALPPFTSVRQALVLDEVSGGVLYAKGAHVRTHPASLTKIATAIVAIERGNLDRVVTVDVDYRNFPGSTLMGLRPGDRFTVRDLLHGLMLASGNDAAVALGRAISGSDAAFVAEMNALVERLALQDTHFMNPHGLDEAGHYTSAYDIGMLARHGMTLPDFRVLVDAESYTARGTRTIAMESLISGLLRWVPGATGVKSGYTDNAGRTLVLSAERDGHRVYAVVMNDPDRELDGATLMQWAFVNHAWPVPATPAIVAQPTPTPGPASDVVLAAREGR